MKSFTLPAGIDPDLLILGGWTYACYQDGRGYVVERWADNPEQRDVLYVDAQGEGYGKLTAVAGRVLVAYRSHGTIYGLDVQGGQRLPMGLCLGNHPCVWGDGIAGMLAIQRPPDCGVHIGQWPDVPAMRISHGKPTGLSRLMVGSGGEIEFVTMDDEYANGLDAPHYVGGNRVSQHGQGGILCHLDGVDGLLRPGEGTYQPRLARQDDGRWTILFGGRDSRGATAQTVLTDVTAADLLPLDADQPSTKPRLLCAYTFNGVQVPAWANAVLPIRPLGRDENEVAIIARTLLPQYQDWPVIGTFEYPFGTIGGHGCQIDRDFVYEDHFGFVGAAMRAGDVAAVRLYRGDDPGQPEPTNWRQAWDDEVAAQVTKYTKARVGLTLNRHLRPSGTTFTLTSSQVADGLRHGLALIEKHDLIGAEVFAVGRVMPDGRPDDAGAEADDVLLAAKAGKTLPDLPTVVVQPPAPPPIPPKPPTPVPTPAPSPAPVPPLEVPVQLMSQADYDAAIDQFGPMAAKFWGVSDVEGKQGIREGLDALRHSTGPDDPGIDGDPLDWIVLAGCRARGVSAADRAELGARVRLQRRRAR